MVWLNSVLLCGAAASLNPTKDPNMNGEYLLSKTPGSPANNEFPTNFKDFPGGVEYFDVYHGPITSLYGQVWWTHTANDIPAEIVKRFDGKGMAIVGIEMDQVRKTPDGDVSVPINIAYNHHHDTAVVGKGSSLEKLDRQHPHVKGAGRDYIRLDMGQVWIAKEHTPSTKGLPTSAMFSDGNGGEYRKSFHAYAPPFAQLVESPTTFAGAPMQIDTWNRDHMNLTGSKFVPGPVPRHNLAPLTGPDARYSGILECPLTTKIEKIFDPGCKGFNDSYHASLETCAHPVNTSEVCFASAKKVQGVDNATVTTKTVSDQALPAGCTLARNTDGGFTATYNTATNTQVGCGEGAATGGLVGTSTAAATDVTLGLNISDASSVVTITMTGPSDVWFGVGFNATLMAGLPYTITVEGGTGKVTERKLANHAAGSVLPASVKVLSSTVVGSKRTVVLLRPITGASASHFTFDATQLSLGFISAVGNGATFAYHNASSAATMQLWPSHAIPTCICSQPPAPFGSGSGFIKYKPTGQMLGFPKGRCADRPREDILAERNPTCDLRTYVGGLMTCHHGWSLLDEDQEQPWADQPLTYYKKFRIYFQEYNSSFHKQIRRHDWGIGADGDHSEYDVMQCPPGTPEDKCRMTITGTWVPVPPATTPSEEQYLIASHHHCHAPTCLRMEMWNNDTGALICRQEPIYGGSGVIDSPTFDENGYIADPPCLWGNPANGLERPLMVSGMTIKIVAITNNTYGHHGEMALPEVSLVQGPLPF